MPNRLYLKPRKCAFLVSSFHTCKYNQFKGFQGMAERSKYENANIRVLNQKPYKRFGSCLFLHITVNIHDSSTLQGIFTSRLEHLKHNDSSNHVE